MIALSIKELSKKYLIYDNSRARLKEWFYMGRRSFHREFWALKNLSFDVPKGQSLGIIGKNGAGKSTLLKLMVGVSKPTIGNIVAVGKISSLLELGAGFHPDFTGRENIYMNAALLGIEKSVVDKKLDTIIGFSELGDFINMPVRFYSSGMAVRLGFSVAINMDPDILIIDEALAVGDIQFQLKCMNAMRDFKKRGVTFVLVSHNLADIGSFCDRVLLIENGRLAMDGNTEKVMESYRLKLMSEEKTFGLSSKRWNPLKIEVRTKEDLSGIKIIDTGFYNLSGEKVDKIRTGDFLKVRITYEATERINNPMFRVAFQRADGLNVLATNTYRHSINLGEVYGKGIMELAFNSFLLNEGTYYVSVSIAPDEYASILSDRAYDMHDMAYTLFVESERKHGGGLVSCPHEWILAKRT